MNYIPLVLTASVDPRGMRSAMFSIPEREKMYVNTLNYYIRYFGKYPKDTFSIIFVENSGWDLNRILDQLHRKPNVNIEMLSLSPNLFCQEHGKGYNEMLLLDLCVQDNKTIAKYGAFFKATGRFPIYNIRKLMRECVQKHNFSLIMDFYDQSFLKKIGLPFSKRSCECRYWAVSTCFYTHFFKGFYKNMAGDKYVENEFFNLLYPLKEKKGVYTRFKNQAFIGGKASVHNKDKSFFLQSKNVSVFNIGKYAVRQLTRIIFPNLWL